MEVGGERSVREPRVPACPMATARGPRDDPRIKQRGEILGAEVCLIGKYTATAQGTGLLAG